MKYKKLLSFLLVTVVLLVSFSAYTPFTMTACACSTCTGRFATTSNEVVLATLGEFDGTDDPKFSSSTTKAHTENVTSFVGVGGETVTVRSGALFLERNTENTTSAMSIYQSTYNTPHAVDFSTSLPSGRVAIKIRMYILDPRQITELEDYNGGGGQIEIGSGSTYDVSEKAWTLKGIGHSWTSRWNEIILPLNSGSDGMTYGQLTWFRMYMNKPSSTLQTNMTNNVGFTRYWFDYVKLVWYPSDPTNERITNFATGTRENTKKFDGTTGTYTYRTEDHNFFNSTDPNKLLLADFRDASAPSLMSSSTDDYNLPGVKTVGSNTGIATVKPGNSFHPTTTAKIYNTGKVEMAKSRHAANHLYNVSTYTSDAAAPAIPKITGGDKYNNNSGWYILLEFGDYVDLSRYSHLCFTFWMSDYQRDSDGLVRAGTPGTIEVNLRDTATTEYTQDGINFQYDIAQATIDESGLINCGHYFHSSLYTYRQRNIEGPEYAAKILKTATRSGYEITPKSINAICIRWLCSDPKVTVAPDIYLGQVFAYCKTDTIQGGIGFRSVSSSQDDTATNTLDPNQVAFEQATTASYCPLSNWDGKQNRTVTVMELPGDKNSFFNGITYGDYRFRAMNYSWPWRYDSNVTFGTYFNRTAYGRGGNFSSRYTRKTGQFLSGNGYKRFTS